MNTDKTHHSGDNTDEGADIEETSALGSAEEESEEESEDASEEGHPAKVVSLLPVHAAPHTGKNALKMTRQRGRPRKVERMATTSDLEYHAKISEQRAAHVAQDAVVRAAQAHADSSDMLLMVKIEVAKESAVLQHQRLETEKLGRDISQISSRRIDALSKIASIELEIKKIGANVIDLKSEKMQRVFKYFIGQLKEVAGETLPPEAIELFFNRLSTALEGWEDKCSDLVSRKGE
jgi:hypothetical protein